MGKSNNKIQFSMLLKPDFHAQINEAAEYDRLQMTAFIRTQVLRRIREIEIEKAERAKGQALLDKK